MADNDNQKTGNGGLYGIIATFSVVIISLAGLFDSRFDSLNLQSQKDVATISELTRLLDEHQRERLNAIQLHLTDRLNSVEAHQAQRVTELDTKLQKEIFDAAAEVKAKFHEVDTSSEQRHDAQQAELNEIKAWFKAPALKNNHSGL